MKQVNVAVLNFLYNLFVRFFVAHNRSTQSKVLCAMTWMMKYRGAGADPGGALGAESPPPPPPSYLGFT